MFFNGKRCSHIILIAQKYMVFGASELCTNESSIFEEYDEKCFGNWSVLYGTWKLRYSRDRLWFGNSHPPNMAYSTNDVSPMILYVVFHRFCTLQRILHKNVYAVLHVGGINMFVIQQTFTIE